MGINQSLPPITCLLPEDTLEQVILHYRINRNNPRANFLPDYLQRIINTLRGDIPLRDYLCAHDELKKYF
jgi:hypothetical protein